MNLIFFNNYFLVLVVVEVPWVSLDVTVIRVTWETGEVPLHSHHQTSLTERVIGPFPLR